MFKSFKSIYISVLAFLAVFAIVYFFKIPVLMGVVFYLAFLFLYLLNGKKSILFTTTMDNPGVGGHVIIAVFIFLLIALCIVPMNLAPFWNGSIPMHRNQYELLADSILDGHLYIDYDDIDPKLLAMENPYDYEERIAQQVISHWDHAFYNGHYYMYFGVVPVFFLFIPFKLLLGKTLVTFHATQFFVMFSIFAFFWLFYMISQKFFPKLQVGTYTLTTSAIITISLGYCVQAPALYCTAISGGIFFMLYSLCFFFYAVYYAKKEGSQILLACIGALLGALAFGCRPPVALANLLAIPLAITYAKNYKGKHLIRNFILIAIPYIIVAGLLMAYNYARFENPFEFGQSYQLTSGDQTIYLSFFERFNLYEIIYNTINNFFTVGTIENTFPHFFYGGLLITYPLMWLVIIYYSKSSVHASMKQDKTALLVLFLLLEPIFVSFMDSYWAPGLCERYRLDEYFVFGILVFMLIGYRLKTTENINRSSKVISAFAVLSILLAILMFFYPCDANFADFYPEKLDEVRKVLTFGL